MSESADPVKALAKELARESAKKIKSSVRSVFGLKNKTKPDQSPSSSASANANANANDAEYGAERYDLAQKLAALSLSSRGGAGSTHTHAHPGFVGGFDAELAQLPSPYEKLGQKYRVTKSPPPDDSSIPPSLIPGFRGGERISMPVPEFAPGVWQDSSLTVQYALLDDLQSRRAGLGDVDSPPPRPHSESQVPPPDFGLSVSARAPVPARSSPRRTRSASMPLSPSSVSTAGGTQCSGVTKAGKRCTRVVKTGPALLSFSPDAEIERFCHQHTKEVLVPSGFYSRKVKDKWIDFDDYIPDYLQADTQVALRVEMEKARSTADESGYIYTFEIRDPKTPRKVKLKVGRAVNLVKRIDQWGKQCGSKEQVLRGWWPEGKEDDGTRGNVSLMKGRVMAGEKGPCCHRVERLVHLELADLSVHAPYLEHGFPKMKKKEKQSASGTPPSSTSAAKKQQNRPCSDCGQVHKEIFVFTRVESGELVGREWEGVVKPVIEKWGEFVREYV